jgi:hypothetical protein
MEIHGKTSFFCKVEVRRESFELRFLVSEMEPVVVKSALTNSDAFPCTFIN